IIRRSCRDSRREEVHAELETVYAAEDRVAALRARGVVVLGADFAREIACLEEELIALQHIRRSHGYLTVGELARRLASQGPRVPPNSRDDFPRAHSVPPSSPLLVRTFEMSTNTLGIDSGLGVRQRADPHSC